MRQPNDIDARPNNITTKSHSNTYKLNVLKVNVNGLNNLNKRDKIFNLLKAKKIDIALLQENHSTKTTDIQRQKKWTGTSFWNSGPTHQSVLVAITFNEKFQGKIQGISMTMQERFPRFLLH